MSDRHRRLSELCRKAHEHGLDGSCPMTKKEFLGVVDRVLEDAGALEELVRKLMPSVSDMVSADIPELNANLMLAVRSLEGAQDRLSRSWHLVS